MYLFLCLAKLERNIDIKAWNKGWQMIDGSPGAEKSLKLQ